MDHKAKRVTKTYNQINNAPPERIFPLLCPVREKDWLDGWDYEMIFSKSGRIEKGCVFSTLHHGNNETIWYVSKHDKKNKIVEFIRLTLMEEVVKINITLHDNGNGTTTSNISYEYTSLNDYKSDWIEKELDKVFMDSMTWWEKAINYYLNTGEKLQR
jgi:hypothetical protein